MRMSPHWLEYSWEFPLFHTSKSSSGLKFSVRHTHEGISRATKLRAVNRTVGEQNYRNSTGGEKLRVGRVQKCAIWSIACVPCARCDAWADV